jgi:hypothetical protein
MSQGPETRLSRLVVWTGRIVYVATLLLLAALAVHVAVSIWRGELLPVPSDPPEPPVASAQLQTDPLRISENLGLDLQHYRPLQRIGQFTRFLL